MDETNEQGVAVTDTAEETPTSDAQTNEQETTPESVDETDSSLETEDEYPEDEAKRREAFIAMRREIKALKEKSQTQTETKDAYDEYEVDPIDMARGTIRSQGDYAPQYQAQQNTQFDESDPATKAFLDRSAQAEQRAQQAEQRALEAAAQLEDFEAWQKYPFLNPRMKAQRSEEEKLFVEDLQAKYLAERLKAMQTGRPAPRLAEVADKVDQHIQRIRGHVTEQAASQVRQEIADKEAATLESRGTTTSIGGSANTDRIEALRMRVRQGDNNALAELNQLMNPEFYDGIE